MPVDASSQLHEGFRLNRACHSLGIGAVLIDHLVKGVLIKLIVLPVIVSSPLGGRCGGFFWTLDSCPLSLRLLGLAQFDVVESDLDLLGRACGHENDASDDSKSHTEAGIYLHVLTRGFFKRVEHLVKECLLLNLLILLCLLGHDPLRGETQREQVDSAGLKRLQLPLVFHPQD